MSTGGTRGGRADSCDGLNLVIFLALLFVNRGVLRLEGNNV